MTNTEIINNLDLEFRIITKMFESKLMDGRSYSVINEQILNRLGKMFMPEEKEESDGSDKGI